MSRNGNYATQAQEYDLCIEVYEDSGDVFLVTGDSKALIHSTKCLFNPFTDEQSCQLELVKYRLGEPVGTTDIPDVDAEEFEISLKRFVEKKNLESGHCVTVELTDPLYTMIVSAALALYREM